MSDDLRKTGKLLGSSVLLTPVGKLSYPVLYTPKPNKFKDNKEFYSTDLWFPPEADLTILKTEIKKALTEKGIDLANPQVKARMQQVVVKSVDDPKSPCPEGWTKIATVNEDRPLVVDTRHTPVDDRRGAYGGRWARVTLNVHAYSNQTKGFTLYLRNVQLLEDDTPFGGGVRMAVADEFPEIETSAGGKAQTADDIGDLF